MIRKAALVPMAWISYKVKDSYEYRQRKSMAVEILKSPEAEDHKQQQQQQPTNSFLAETTPEYIDIIDNDGLHVPNRSKKHNLILPDIVTDTSLLQVDDDHVTDDDDVDDLSHRSTLNLVSLSPSPSSPEQSSSNDVFSALLSPLPPRSQSTPSSPLPRDSTRLSSSRVSSSLVSSSKDDSYNSNFQHVVDSSSSSSRDPVNLNRRSSTLTSSKSSQHLSSSPSSSSASVVHPSYIHSQPTNVLESFAELQASKDQLAQSRVKTASLFTSDTPPSPLPPSSSSSSSSSDHHTDPDSAFSFHHPDGDESF